MAVRACAKAPKDRERRMLILAEVLRWIVIVVPIILGAWRYGTIRGYTVFIPNVDRTAQYWGMIALFITGASLLLYLPLKILSLKYRMKNDKLVGLNWRPSIVSYIVLSATPVLVMIVVAAKMEGQAESYMDPTTVVVLQVSVLGLTLTEWISKLREEHLTFDLVSAAANDFFFAYDVIDFIMMATYEEEIYHSDWVYVCFAFAFVSMFKYVPSQPINITGDSAPRSKTAILVGMFCCDVPFVIVRLWTMIIFDFRVSDLLHPVKNIALIVFDIMQLVIISQLKDQPKPPEDVTDGIMPHVAPHSRRVRREDVSDVITPTDHAGWDLIRRRIRTLIDSTDNNNDSGQRHANPAFEHDDSSDLGTTTVTSGSPAVMT